MKKLLLAALIALSTCGCLAPGHSNCDTDPITVWLEFKVQPRISAEVDAPVIVKQTQAQKQQQKQSQSSVNTNVNTQNVKVGDDGGSWYDAQWIWWVLGGVLLAAAGGVWWILQGKEKKTGKKK